jgi:hypothetical protein
VLAIGVANVLLMCVATVLLSPWISLRRKVLAILVSLILLGAGINSQKYDDEKKEKAKDTKCEGDLGGS